ncbi:hypothetical protein CIHG_00457 [Coccidioides immitis H538.4]|uniref:Uncharacterized protein n=1 Tax=Coccidioides immitis H538.4 TaxID=396776 RepID=A0A0J8RDQ9_COCIT|nr:hypothetical protein CIHG_00457 [Coccidioides immitis H538.4]
MAQFTPEQSLYISTIEVLSKANSADPSGLDPYVRDESPVSPLGEPFAWPSTSTGPDDTPNENKNRGSPSDSNRRNSFICRNCGFYNGRSNRSSPISSPPPSPPPPPPPPKSPPRQLRYSYLHQQLPQQYQVQEGPSPQQLPPEPQPQTQPQRQSRFYANLAPRTEPARHSTYIPTYSGSTSYPNINGDDLALFSQSMLHLFPGAQSTSGRPATTSFETCNQSLCSPRKLVKRRKNERDGVPPQGKRHSTSFLGSFAKIFGTRRNTENGKEG